MSREFDLPSWWVSLKHGGLLIAPSKLRQSFLEEPPALSSYHSERLRRAIVRFLDGDAGHLATLLDTVLQEVLGHDGLEWQKGAQVDPCWSQKAMTGEILKPRRVWKGPFGATLAVFVADVLGISVQRKRAARLGVGRGRRAVARVVEWLRRSGEKLAILTNGRQWRLIHAGADYEAWCEWDVDLWFSEGEPGPQVTALRLLLGVAALSPKATSDAPPLLAAILASRKGQAELSSVLGERVRRAVEHLIQVSSAALETVDAEGAGRVARRDIYIAACRIVMRCVVLLFAEARDLLPRDNAVYHRSYSLEGLREQLVRQAGGHAKERLRHSHGAWPRMLALFRLVYQGSAHEALPIPRYGGALFQPGDPEVGSPIRRALAAFESPVNAPHDGAVYRILDLLTRSKVKLQQGNRSTWVQAPVDFSDLSSEFIGILYEGLLDFELRRVGEDDAMVFLNLGDQPALPLLRLVGMTAKESKVLLEKLKTDSKPLASGDDEGEAAGEDGGEHIDRAEERGPENEAEEDAEADTDDLDADEEDGDEEQSARDLKRDLSERVEDWARRAVREAKLVKLPKNDTDPRAREVYNRKLEVKTQALIDRVILPGEWYLVRWGGTRKGSGTFYTPPQLASPTVRRTLRPLAYEVVSAETDEKTELVTVTEWRPRKPEEILALKVCDPAMGSGSFLVSALRFLTDALVESLHNHDRLQPRRDGTIVKLADGLPLDHPSQETLPVPPEHGNFEEHLRARLKRHVVERCIYGVDFDPLAVELGRMAMWVETMDPRLPFGFLDHKLKLGNSLVGCWFDRFQDYPVMAWEREGGDKNHERFVHHVREYEITRGKKKGEKARKGDLWTQAIKDQRNGVVKDEMVEWIRLQRGDVLPFVKERHQTAEDVHADTLAAFETLHGLPLHQTERREQLYREEIQGEPDFQRLRAAFDTWCSIWFWPGELMSAAPTPLNFLDPPEETRTVVRKLADQERFFHWELEFPDVFHHTESGFDALIGNPPWEIQKPNSKEFFSNVDPLYKTYGKQEALAKQVRYFESQEVVERNWIEYCARLKAMSNWTKHVAFPFGDPSKEEGGSFSFSRSKKANTQLHLSWRLRRRARRGYADPRHPFRHQGSADINTYKMFLEGFHALLRPSGRMGLLIPSGLYSDKGTSALRRLLLEHCHWSHLYAFQNERFVFQDIHHSFKIVALCIEKGGETRTLRTRFRLGPGDSPELHEIEEDLLADERFLPLPVSSIRRFSPDTGALLEVRSERDLEILEKIYTNGVLLGDQSPEGWSIRYATEFHMTNASHLFPPRPKWEAKGYRPDAYGHWLKGAWRPYNGPTSILKRPRGLVLSADGREAVFEHAIEGVALPLYQGVMVQQFDFAPKRWISGTGVRAIWQIVDWNKKTIGPQFLMSLNDYLMQEKAVRGVKPAIRRVARSTDERTIICSIVNDAPCGDKAAIFAPRGPLEVLLLTGLVNSLVFDWIARTRVAGTQVDYHLMAELPTPVGSKHSVSAVVAAATAALNIPSFVYSALWSEIHKTLGFDSWHRPWHQHWALTPHERLRLRSYLDAVIAISAGLDEREFKLIVDGCDWPSDSLALKAFTRDLDPRGFWRVDKTNDPELRQTVLSLVAFQDLKRAGFETLVAEKAGIGWMLPETLRLADYGLGHDDRAKEHQPVASRLGPRFYDWQLEQSVEESWEECERHAELIAKIVPPPQEQVSEVAEPNPPYDPPTDLFGNPLDTDLFGNVVPPKTRRR